MAPSVLLLVGIMYGLVL